MIARRAGSLGAEDLRQAATLRTLPCPWSPSLFLGTATVRTPDRLAAWKVGRPTCEGKCGTLVARGGPEGLCVVERCVGARTAWPGCLGRRVGRPSPSSDRASARGRQAAGLQVA